MYCMHETKGQLRPIDTSARPHLSFLAEVTLDSIVEHELGVEVIEDTLDTPNTGIDTGYLVSPGLADDVKELGVKVVEAAIATDGGVSKGDEGSCGKGVLGGALVRWRLVVVSAVHQESMGS